MALRVRCRTHKVSEGKVSSLKPNSCTKLRGMVPGDPAPSILIRVYGRELS